MSINITMPALSPTMEEGNLSKWLVKEGDAVAAGDVIAEIETDKATMEVESIDEGTVAKILVAEGSEGVKVNSIIAVLAEDGEDVASIEVSEKPSTANEEAAEIQKTEEIKPVHATLPSQQATENKSTTDRVFATPLARRIAEQNGIDIASINGSGPHGRIIKADVESVLNESPAQQRSAASDPASHTVKSALFAKGMSDSEVLAFYDSDAIESRPHDGMRRVIAERLTQSAQTIPSYFITMDCELDAMLALRAQINAAAPRNDDDKPLYKISVNDFIVKIMAMALKAVPMANVSWTSTDRIYHKHCDIGVAVAVEDGLFTPIVRNAEEKTLSVISSEIKDMAGRARSRKLKPEEYQGGSTAVSNLGMFGVKEFTSIINPPHASIVSIGAGEKRAVVKDGELSVATMMSATFAFDHRAIDGALGAELAAAFKNLVENPMNLLV